ncbi:mediator of RNA polymerase II transcription subunit 10 [Pleomassaria siparia CBS 279.74]|uniref:Mediator of RNA polymerase II transcription subunit 10 n=1 Tax=Pleomassaria siparia CBS 279.74 TaxID=1314801 RepID=A0A6G1KIZ6_9PLEO|nr:mediator of RNA polymerase II transcription subunit 10 [Pleomassaria siparia CBS 279.74]
MAPGIEQTPLNIVDAQLKDIVQNLYNLIVQAVEHQGAPTQDAMKREIASLVQNLVKLSRTAPSVAVNIPPEVTQYVEKARNPDIFTREFVETAQRMNQMLKGRTKAYLLLRDVLANGIISAIPALEADVKKVVESTTGTAAT